MAEYDLFSESFARTRKKHWPDINELIGLFPNEAFLGKIGDIGCGSGRLVEYFPNYNPENYIGIDISSRMIDIARKTYPEIDFRVLGMSDIGQIGQKLDTILFIASLQHICTIEEQKAVLLAAYNQLNDGGYIGLLNWNLLSLEAIKKYPPTLQNANIREIPFQGNIRTYYSIDPRELDSILNVIGFEQVKSIESSTGMNFLTIARKV